MKHSNGKLKGKDSNEKPKWKVKKESQNRTFRQKAQNVNFVECSSLTERTNGMDNTKFKVHSSDFEPLERMKKNEKFNKIF